MSMVYGRTPPKPDFSGHLKLDKTKVLITYDSLMKVKSIAEMLPFCNAFDLHYAIIGIGNQFLECVLF